MLQKPLGDTPLSSTRFFSLVLALLVILLCCFACQQPDANERPSTRKEIPGLKPGISRFTSRFGL